MSPAWRLQAACLGTDPELWFDADPARVAEARAVCAGCPVTAQCAAAAAGERFGVWAGLTAEERCPRRAPGRPRRTQTVAA